jgi:DNA-binding transcriptional ArsR family regulator
MRPRPLPQIQAAYPHWRGWRTADGGLLAREGGSIPARAQARGRTLAELKLAISCAILAAASRDAIAKPVLRPREQAVLDALKAAAGPLPARTISDATGMPISTARNVLAVLQAQGFITRRRDGRTWFYAVRGGRKPHGDGQQAEAGV